MDVSSFPRYTIYNKLTPFFTREQFVDIFCGRADKHHHVCFLAQPLHRRMRLIATIALEQPTKILIPKTHRVNAYIGLLCSFYVTRVKAQPSVTSKTSNTKISLTSYYHSLITVENLLTSLPLILSVINCRQVVHWYYKIQSIPLIKKTFSA